MKNQLFSCFAILTVTVISSCGNGTEYGVDPVTAMYDSIAKADSIRLWGPATTISFSSGASDEKYDLQRVTIDGYIGISESITQTETTTTIELWERNGQRIGEPMQISVTMGHQPNQMDSLPENYTKSDLHIIDNTGKGVVLYDKVKITGIYHRPVNSAYGTIDVQLIQKQVDEPFDYETVNTVCITPGKSYPEWENKVVCADGYLIVPSSVQVTDVVPMKLISQYYSEDSLSIEILIGNTPNRIEDLPMNYTDESIKVHDSGDKLVKEARVRVYGVWHNGVIHVEYVQKL